MRNMINSECSGYVRERKQSKHAVVHLNFIMSPPPPPDRGSEGWD